MHTRLKRAAERLLVCSGFTPLGRVRQRGRVLVLAYHNILGPAERARGELSLHLPLPDFRAQLDALERHCVVVSLADILAGKPLAKSAPSVAITFDDAYQGALDHGLSELAARRLPSTLFVAPGLLGVAGCWWDALADGQGKLDSTTREACLVKLAGREREVRAAAPSRGWTLVDPGLRVSTVEELAGVVEKGGVTLGAHSWSHPNLVRIEAGAVAVELARPLEWLRQRFAANTLTAIAYPYGLSSPAVRAATAKAGYTAGFLVDGGWAPLRMADPFAQPRFNVPAGLSIEGFLLRLAGWGAG